MINCDCSEFGKILEGSTGHTGSCNRQRRKEEERARRVKIVTREIKKISPKMAQALVEYTKLRKKFLEANPVCAVYPDKKSEDVHHMKGRATIERLLDTNFWLAVSREGHIWIENHPEEAKEKGFSLSRLATEQK